MTGMLNQLTAPDAKRRKSPTVLLIDDDENMGALLQETLTGLKIELATATTGEAGFALAKRIAPSLVLLDLNLPDVTGMSLLDRLLNLSSATEIVVISGDHSMSSTVDCVKRGALDYLTKPLDIAKLREQIQAWIEQVDSYFPRHQTELLAEAESEGIIGRSRPVLEIVSKVLRLAPRYRNALITGPTGSGKELVAKLLHRRSGRRGPMVVFNCAAVPEPLFESELFGHAKGAFTGATQDRVGIAEHAAGGTLFLDEVGELAPPMQATLLRLVQNRESKRLGTTTVRQLDLRIIAASSRNLRQMVKDKTFREDLYHRLSTVELCVPRLTERHGDIPVLTSHFLKILCQRYSRPQKQFSPAAQEMLTAYAWPGNVRELESVVDYCCLMCNSDQIDVQDLPEFVKTSGTETSQSLLSLQEMEKRHLICVLDQLGGNRTEAAALLGIGRATVYRILAGERDDEA